MTADLAPFFEPRSVAVVGAGERATSSGGAVLRNLRIGGYSGEIIPVNPKGGTILGLPVKASLRDLAEPADLAIIVIRPDLIPEAVEDAAASDHRNLLILPGGFTESGPEGIARDKQVRAIAARAGIRIAGPNCAGIIHIGPRMKFGGTFLRDFPPGGSIAMISQSGALAEEAIAFANDHALKLGTVVTVGNAMHLGITEYLDYLGDRDEVGGLLIYAESVSDRDAFTRVARRVAARKPIVMLVGGRGPAGIAAARAHTGDAIGGEAAIDAFCEAACAIRARSLRHLLLAAKGFGFYPDGIGGRVLILSNSGGPGVIATDRAEAETLQLPALPAAMAAALRARLPGEASVANPVDLLADAREDRFGEAFGLAQAHGPGTFDAVLGIHVVPFMVDADPVVARLVALAGQAKLPFFHAMMGTLPKKAEWFAALEAAGVPAFNDVEAMAEVAGLLARYPALKARAQAAS
ncbi:CoA-binding protein [Oceanibacterium hippocampi]|uniref:Succinyl-CoA synthetase subunit alpha n=1 Tax=Oceanibacterium hippocampi TaxID=745714 RepID=A0A1Y5RHF5_9PROT|nr:CoA-binding protein [Oceanibacterium hippocampi]SLN17482.1 succinyl-CoA synthetase subunit alpha [Oceanibacterium hippocampi]